MSNIYYQRPNNSDKKNGTEYTGYYHPNYQMPQYNPSNKIVPHPQGYKKRFNCQYHFGFAQHYLGDSFHGIVF